MRVIFFGTGMFALPSLKGLAASRHAVILCVTRPDRAQGRGRRLEPSPVKRAALRLGLPLAQPERPEASTFQPLQPDVGVVVDYGQLIGRELLGLAPHGMLGVHPSLLPKYRGAAPVAWAVLKGETTTGVTIFRLNERLDAGDVVSQQPTPIGLDEDAGILTARLAELGAQELVRSLDSVETGRAVFLPQDEAQASLAPKLTKTQGRIDWHQPAAGIERLVRALVPWPGATTIWQGRVLKVWKVSASQSAEATAGGHEPGRVIRVGPEALTVAAGGGALDLLDVQPEGRRRMSIREFLAGHHVTIGEKFG